MLHMLQSKFLIILTDFFASTKRYVTFFFVFTLFYILYAAYIDIVIFDITSHLFYIYDFKIIFLHI